MDAFVNIRSKKQAVFQFIHLQKLNHETFPFFLFFDIKFLYLENSFYKINQIEFYLFFYFDSKLLK